MARRSKQIIQAVPLAAFLLLSASAQTITGKVVGVSDGDTITVLDASNKQYKIRLDGIDAPESNQNFGTRAKQSLSELVFGKTVTVISSKKDRYGRTLGKVMLGNQNINLEQLNRGMAWFYRAYAKELKPEDAKAYERAEIAAKDGALGLWREPNPIAPWFFRRPDRGAKGAVAVNVPVAGGQVIGNRASKIYHLPNCPDYGKVSERNRVPFASEAEAVKAGYRKAKNCL